MVILLIGNYTKNLNSGINLEPQIIDTYTCIDNHNIPEDKVWVFTSPENIKEIISQKFDNIKRFDNTIFDDYIILGILGINPPDYPGYCYEMILNNVRIRGSQININYQTKYNQINCEVLLQESAPYGPQSFFKISRDKLPVGIPLEFIFHNQTTKTKQIINQTITL